MALEDWSFDLDRRTLFHKCGSFACVNAEQKMACFACSDIAPPTVQFLARIYGVYVHRKRRQEILDELTTMYQAEYGASSTSQIYQAETFEAHLFSDIPAIVLRERVSTKWEAVADGDVRRVLQARKIDFHL